MVFIFFFRTTFNLKQLFFKQIFINYYDLKELSFFLMIYTIGTLPSSFYYSVIGQYALRIPIFEILSSFMHKFSHNLLFYYLLKFSII